MKKLFRRFLAYFIDVLVVTIIAQCLSSVPFLNKQLNSYNKYYDDYMELYGDYTGFKVDLKKNFDDKKLDEDEYNSLVEDYEIYTDLLNKYYKEGKLTEKNYDKLNKKVDNKYLNDYKKVYYKIEKNSIAYFVVYLIAIFAYFVGFNKYTGGQTLGKKLTRLKIVNNTDSNKDVSVWSYVVRTLILYQPIYYVVRLIGISFMDVNMYYTTTSVFYDIQYFLEILIVFMIMIRIDGRGIHDMLAKTRVILYDKNGEEVVDKLDMMITKKMDSLKKDKKKKIIDEEPSE